MFNTHQKDNLSIFAGIQIAETGNNPPIIKRNFFLSQTADTKSGRYYDYIDLRNTTGVLGLKAGLVTALEQPGDAPQLFAIDTENNLRTISSEMIEGSAFPRWSNAWETIPTEPLRGARPTIVRIKAVRLCQGGPIHLFAVDASSRLWYMTQDASGRWDVPADLGVSASRLAVSYAGKDPSDPSALRVVAVSPRGDLTLLSRTGGQDWTIQPVNTDNPYAKEFRTVTRFTAEITVKNTNGLPVQNPPDDAAHIGLTATDDSIVRVNGHPLNISDTADVQVALDGSGRVVLETELDDQLGAPTFTVSSGNLSNPLQVVPNADVQDHFAAISGQQLSDARDPQGNPVLKRLPAADYDKIAEKMRQSVEDARNLQAGLPGGSGKPMDRTGRSPWSVRFEEDQPVITDLSAGRFEELWNSAVEATADTAIVDELGGFLGVDWGSLWDGIRKGLIKGVEVAIDGFRAVVTIGKTILSFVLKAARDFFDVVLGLLEAAGAAFGALVGWLLKTLDFFDDWPLILKNRDHLKTFFKTRLKQQAGKLPDLATYKPVVDKWFDDVEGSVDSWFAGIEAALGGTDKTFQGNAAGRTSWDWPSGLDLPAGIGALPGQQAIEWLAGEVADALLGALDIPTPNMPKTQASFETLVSNLETELKSDVETLVTGIGKDVQKWVDDPGGFQSQIFADVVKDIVQPVVDDTLEFGRTATEDGLDMAAAAVSELPELIDWLDAEIKLPFLTEFYDVVLNTIEGGGADNRLSVLDVMMLMNAVLVTRVVGDVSVLEAAMAGDADALDNESLNTVLMTLTVTTSLASTLIDELIETVILAQAAISLEADAKEELELAIVTLISSGNSLISSLFGFFWGENNPADRPLKEILDFWIVTMARSGFDIALAGGAVWIAVRAVRGEEPPRWFTGQVLSTLFTASALGNAVGLAYDGFESAASINDPNRDGTKTAVTLSTVVALIGMASSLVRVGRPVLQNVVKDLPPRGRLATIAIYVGLRTLAGFANPFLAAGAMIANQDNEQVPASAAE